MTITDGKNYINEVRDLIREYTGRLGRDLTFQKLDDELDDPAKKYLPPAGELLVAIDGGKVVGMVAYHKHSPARCEMKRLYVKPECRGKDVGRALAEAIIEKARSDGFSEMVLDTLKPMHAAIGLYRSLGFEECEPYYANPMPDVIYMKKHL